MLNKPICTHLSNMGILLYQVSEGKAEAGSVNNIVQTIIQAMAGIKNLFCFFKKKICCNDNSILLKRIMIDYYQLSKGTPKEVPFLTNYRTKNH